MPCPRKNKNFANTSVENLYTYLGRDGKTVRFRYKNVITKKFTTLNTTNKLEAELKAKQLNAVIAQMLLDQQTKEILGTDTSHSITVGKMHQIYLERLQDRVDRGEIEKSTLDDRRWKIKAVAEKRKNLTLAQYDTLVINKDLDSYKNQGKDRMASAVRSILIDFFREAVFAGYYPADKPNPAQTTRSPRVVVKRSRLTLEVFNRAIEWSKMSGPERRVNAPLLALVTGQRLEDVATLKRTRFKSLDSINKKGASGIVVIDGQEYLALVQRKTGNRVMIPLDLRLNVIGYSVRDVLGLCQDDVASKYVLHHSKYAGRAKPGHKIRAKTLSNEFAESIDALKVDWGNKEPASFQEIRSLSKRLYSEQGGVDTKKLLGHKTERCSDLYADARGDDWLVVQM